MTYTDIIADLQDQVLFNRQDNANLGAIIEKVRARRDKAQAEAHHWCAQYRDRAAVAEGRKTKIKTLKAENRNLKEQVRILQSKDCAENLANPADTLNYFRDKCGEAAEANGWHKGYRQAVHHRRELGPDFEQALIDHVVAKTTLITNEVSEAIEEIRDGSSFDVTYYGEDGKPEGYPSELADVIIRALDLAYMLGIDIDTAVTEKLDYNATRGHMHGGKKL